MKKSNIAFLFQKNEVKKVTTCAPPILVVDEGLSIPIVEDPPIMNDESTIIVVDEGTCEEQEETPIETATTTTTYPPVANDESAFIVVDEGRCEEQEETPTETSIDPSRDNGPFY